MTETQLLAIWKNYDQRLDEQLRLNRSNALEITRMKVHSFISGMKPIKLFTLILGILWVAFLDLLLIAVWKKAAIYFLVSFSAISLLNTLAVGCYVYQTILIWQADRSLDILHTQEKIARLTASTISVTRILFLQLPFWTTFFLSGSMIRNATPAVILAQLSVTTAFAVAAMWLFKNIDLKNKDKKWFSLIFSGAEWEPVVKAARLLEQAKELTDGAEENGKTEI